MPDPAVHEPYPELTISFLRGDTPDRFCSEYPDRFYAQFTTPSPKRPGVGAYEDGCSILVTPATFDDWWSSPASYWMRQRYRKAGRDGYRFEVIERDRFVDDIYAINTSMDERQGRPMSDAYRSRPKGYGALPPYPCPHHLIRTYGIVHEDGHLYAYSWVYQVGEMCLFSTILGHGERMKSGIMVLLVVDIVRDLMATAGLKYAMYNMHDSGTDGLRFFKEQLGFRPYRVHWRLGDEPEGWVEPDRAVPAGGRHDQGHGLGEAVGSATASARAVARRLLRGR